MAISIKKKGDTVERDELAQVTPTNDNRTYGSTNATPADTGKKEEMRIDDQHSSLWSTKNFSLMINVGIKIMSFV